MDCNWLILILFSRYLSSIAAVLLTLKLGSVHSQRAALLCPLLYHAIVALCQYFLNVSFCSMYFSTVFLNRIFQLYLSIMLPCSAPSSAMLWLHSVIISRLYFWNLFLNCIFNCISQLCHLLCPLDHSDGQFFSAMEWLMFFFRPPLTTMVFQWF